MACPNNCSNHGECFSGTCSCFQDFVFTDCSGFVTPSLRSAFAPVRWLELVLHMSITVVVVWRLFVVAATKRRAHQQRHISGSGNALFALCGDTQIITLFLVLLASVCWWIQWLLPNDIVDYYQTIYLDTIFNAGTALGALSGGLFVQFFISIFVRFHPPSKRIATAFLVTIFLFFILWTTVIIIIAAANTAKVDYYLAGNILSPSALLYILLSFGFLLSYGIAVVKPSSDAAVARAQSEAERRSRTQLLTIIKTILACIIVFFVLEGWEAFGVLRSSDVAQYFTYDAIYIFFWFILLMLLVYVMGRTKPDDQGQGHGRKAHARTSTITVTQSHDGRNPKRATLTSARVAPLPIAGALSGQAKGTVNDDAKTAVQEVVARDT